MTARDDDAATADGYAVDASHTSAEPCRMLIRAWEAWRGRDLVPPRAAVDLAGIKELLPGLMLLEVESRDSIVFRVVGTEIDRALGIGITGCNYLDFARPERRALRAERMARQVAWPCGARMVTRFMLPNGTGAPLEVVALPLRVTPDAVPRQVIAVVGGLEEELVRDGPSTAPLDGASDIYEYFDIGAGVPREPDPADFTAS